MQRSIFKDQERQPKPLIDKYEAIELDQWICYAMDNNIPVKTVRNDGFTEDVIGHVQYVDPITHQLRIEVKVENFRH
jgi:hypothetical protein